METEMMTIGTRKQINFNKGLPKFLKSMIITFTFILLNYNALLSQVVEGFNPNEAKDLIALCNSFTFIDKWGSDTTIIPENYKKVFTSEVIGLDNMFQVYENDKVGIINFRGSTRNVSSWIENFYTAMIPANGKIKIDNIDCHYKFASDTIAAVHAGYALGVILLSPTLIEQINNLNRRGIYDILITGHSQGGALALLSRAYLENLLNGEVSSENVFKTYTFANPMVGNVQFTKEYEFRFSANNMSYSIVNQDDIVPRMPIHFENEFSNNQGLKKMFYGIAGNDKPIFKQITQNIFESSLRAYIIATNHMIEHLMVNSFVTVEISDYAKDVNYFRIDSVLVLEPFQNRNLPVNTENLTKRNIAKLEQGENGNYYRKEGASFQHKPYQYYVAILREYFSKEYESLEVLCLPEVDNKRDKKWKL